MAPLSIVIVAWNSASVIEACLASLDAHAYRHGQEVIVVDNDSGDDTAERVTQGFPQVKLIRSGGNIGYGRALNLGALHARGELLLLLNPDVRVGPGSIDAMVQALSDDESVGVVGCEQRSSDGELRAAGFYGYPSCASVVQEVLRYPSGIQRLLFSGSKRNAVDGSRKGPEAVDWVLGSVILMRARDFRALGGFDEFIFLYLEEIDLCLRAKRDLGKKVVYVPGYPIEHDGGVDAGRWGGPRKTSFFLSAFYFVRKHHGQTTYVCLRAGFLGAALWSCLYEGAKRPFSKSDFEFRAALRIATLPLRPMGGAQR